MILPHYDPCVQHSAFGIVKHKPALSTSCITLRASCCNTLILMVIVRFTSFLCDIVCFTIVYVKIHFTISFMCVLSSFSF